MENNTLSVEQLQEQAAIAERLAAAGLPVLTAEKIGQYCEAGNAKRLAAIRRMSRRPMDADEMDYWRAKRRGEDV